MGSPTPTEDALVVHQEGPVVLSKNSNVARTSCLPISVFRASQKVKGAHPFGAEFLVLDFVFVSPTIDYLSALDQ